MGNERIINSIQYELTQIIGPVAYIILNEKVKSFEKTKANFPINKMTELIEKISVEIYDETKRALFQNNALKKLGELSSRTSL